MVTHSIPCSNSPKAVSIASFLVAFSARNNPSQERRGIVCTMKDLFSLLITYSTLRYGPAARPSNHSAKDLSGHHTTRAAASLAALPALVLHLHLLYPITGSLPNGTKCQFPACPQSDQIGDFSLSDAAGDERLPFIRADCAGCTKSGWLSLNRTRVRIRSAEWGANFRQGC